MLSFGQATTLTSGKSLLMPEVPLNVNMNMNMQWTHLCNTPSIPFLTFMPLESAHITSVLF